MGPYGLLHVDYLELEVMETCGLKRNSGPSLNYLEDSKLGVFPL